MDLTGGIGIRFERDEAGSTGVTMDSVTVTCPGHGVEVWNVVDLEIGEVIARDVGNSGLLIQNTIDGTLMVPRCLRQTTNVERSSRRSR